MPENVRTECPQNHTYPLINSLITSSHGMRGSVQQSCIQSKESLTNIGKKQLTEEKTGSSAHL